jgi:hypothetical protein
MHETMMDDPCACAASRLKALTVKPSFSDRNATVESGSMLVGTVRCSIVKQLSTTIEKN